MKPLMLDSDGVFCMDLLAIAIPASQLFLAILNPGIGNVPIPGFQDYKKIVKYYFSTVR